MTRNAAVDGFGKGVNYRGQYRFNSPDRQRARGHAARATPATPGTTSPRAATSTATPTTSRSSPRTTGGSTTSLTVFLGLRWELVGHVAREGRHARQLHPRGRRLPRRAERRGRDPDAAGRCRPSAATSSPTSVGLTDTLSTRTRTTSARASASRGGSAATTKHRAAGRLRALPPDRGHPGPARPDGHQPVPLREAYGGGPLAHAFSQGTPSVDSTDFGTQGIDPNIQAPDIYQYNLTLERELPGDLGLRVSYIGSTMRKLAQQPRLQHAAAPAPSSWTRTTPTTRPAAVPPVRLLHGQHRQPRRGPAPRAAARAAAPLARTGWPFERGLHARPLGRHRPRHRQQQPGPGHVRHRTTSRRTAVRTRTW